MAKQPEPAQANQLSKSALAVIEEAVVDIWAKENTFQASLDNRAGGPHYEFYDGPPFANGLPHVGHATSSIVKDAVPRYKTMRGYHVPRRFGWDCHGLPAEMKAEQDLDLGSKAAIEEYGVAKFVDYCRRSVTEFTKEWEYYINRLGRWVDFSDNYYTMDDSYMQSVMWAFKHFYDRGLVREGFKVMPYCHVCETSLSHFETRQDDSYREREDLAVTVRFPLETGESLLAWTTTPWTLPANLAVAVNKDLDYVVMEGNGERFLLAPEAIERYAKELTDYKKAGTRKGSDLIGHKYEPPFSYFVGHPNAHQVIHADFVTADDGTGIAHEAPGFGEDDQVVCEANGISVVVPVDKQGNYTAEIVDFAGMNVFAANAKVADHLKNQGRLFKQETYRHSYPHCWRTDNPLIYRAVSTWMIDVPSFKQALIDKNKQVNWMPENVKDGAFGKWLEGVRVWNVSRDRFWGAPIPVWKTDDGEVLVIGSLDEIKAHLADDKQTIDLHKPYVDDIVLKTKSGKLARRVSEVFDCWFESGSMPFAQHGYIGKDDVKLNHPADFIVEYIGQVRGWFYTLHVISTALFDDPAFKNVISHGVILGSDGRKLSKRLKNYPDMNHLFDTYGADSLRYALLESPVVVGETILVDEKAMQDASRNVFTTLLNSYNFYAMYAEVDGFRPPAMLAEPTATSLLDRWMLSRLNQTIGEVTVAADAYDLPKAVRPLRLLIDDLSNWYIRRSRRRFWKSEDDADKQAAYEVLWYSLVRICQLLAPWAPFLPDHLYRQLTAGTGLPSSVHTSDWPQAGAVNAELLGAMAATRQVISDGLAARADAKIKVRQPLSALTVVTKATISSEMVTIIEEEVNVKAVVVSQSDIVESVKLDTVITPALAQEGFARELVRHIQALRKKSGLQVSDRIELTITTDQPQALNSISAQRDYIMHETLATNLQVVEAAAPVTKAVQINGADCSLSLKKA